MIRCVYHIEYYILHISYAKKLMKEQSLFPHYNKVYVNTFMKKDSYGRWNLAVDLGSLIRFFDL